MSQYNTASGGCTCFANPADPNCNGHLPSCALWGVVADRTGDEARAASPVPPADAPTDEECAGVLRVLTGEGGLSYWRNSPKLDDVRRALVEFLNARALSAGLPNSSAMCPSCCGPLFTVTGCTAPACSHYEPFVAREKSRAASRPSETPEATPTCKDCGKLRHDPSLTVDLTKECRCPRAARGSGEGATP